MGEGRGCEWVCDVGVYEGDGEGGGGGGDAGIGVVAGGGGGNGDERFALSSNRKVYSETEAELKDVLKGIYTRAGEAAIEELLRVYPEGGAVPPYALGPGDAETTRFCEEMGKA